MATETIRCFKTKEAYDRFLREELSSVNTRNYISNKESCFIRLGEGSIRSAPYRSFTESDSAKNEE